MCLSVCSLVCLFIFLPAFLSVHLSVTICLIACLPACLLASLSTHLSACLSACQSVYPFVCLSVSLSLSKDRPVVSVNRAIFGEMERERESRTSVHSTNLFQFSKWFPFNSFFIIRNKNENERSLWNLALYLYKSFSRHKIIMFWSVPYAKMFTMDWSLCSCLILYIFCILYLSLTPNIYAQCDAGEMCKIIICATPSPPLPPTHTLSRGYGLTE